MHEAFRYAHQAAAYEVASKLFGERIMSIDPDPSWSYPSMPTTLVEWLESKEERIDKALDPDTARLMSEAWQTSQEDASSCGIRLSKKQKLNALTDIVGHVVNLTICLESILNRQLFFLREVGQLTPDLYRSIDRAELMPKLLFCFKEEIVSKKIRVSRIRQLVSFRNNSVHYRIDSPDALKPSHEDLIEIWRELGEVLALTTGEPTQDDIRSYADGYIRKWIEA
jgi:hypothetical protein